MRASRWVCGLTTLGTLAASALVVGVPGSAAADDTRFSLTARGDAFYFEVNGDEIPASPNNDAGSLTAFAETTNSGGSKGFAGMPYYGNTMQTLPGTINGIPNQFGAGQVQLPFAVMPGFVQTASNSTPEAEQDFGYGRVSSSSKQTAATSSAAYGAPTSVPAPNQQQTANASTESRGHSVTAVASGSSSGFVSGPLEVGNSTALASITQSVGREAKVESKTFGRFSVSGQEFGFDQNGFRYLGESQSSDEAIAQANSVLQSAGIQIGLAPAGTAKDESGKTTYTIGGLMITTTQASPTGTGSSFTVTYILGRATVGATVAQLGFGSSSSTVGDVTEGATASTVDDGSAAMAASGTSGDDLATAVLPADLAALAAQVPTEVGTIGDAGADSTAHALPASLRFSPMVHPSDGGGSGLYAMLALAGLAVLGGHFMFSRFAVPPQV